MRKYKRGISPKTNKEKLTKNDKRFINLFWFFMGFFVVHALFFEEDTIGHDSRYALYIFALPLVMGMIGWSFYFFKSYMTDLFNLKKVWSKMILTGLYLLLVASLSYFSFAQFVGVAWNYINKKTAATNPEKTFYAHVDEFFFSNKTCSIRFKFKNQSEHIKVGYKDIEQYKNVSPKRYQIGITAQKGIWNYYIVKYWEIIDKEDTVINVTQ